MRNRRLSSTRVRGTRHTCNLGNLLIKATTGPISLILLLDRSNAFKLESLSKQAPSTDLIALLAKDNFSRLGNSEKSISINCNSLPVLYYILYDDDMIWDDNDDDENNSNESEIGWIVESGCNMIIWDSYLNNPALLLDRSAYSLGSIENGNSKLQRRNRREWVRAIECNAKGGKLNNDRL